MILHIYIYTVCIYIFIYSMYRYICVYIYVYIHIHTHIHMYTYTYTHIVTYIYMHICIYTYMHIYNIIKYRHINIYTCCFFCLLADHRTSTPDLWPFIISRKAEGERTTSGPALSRNEITWKNSAPKTDGIIIICLYFIIKWLFEEVYHIFTHNQVTFDK